MKKIFIVISVVMVICCIAACVQPKAGGLESLSLTDAEISPSFDKDVFEYTASVPSDYEIKKSSVSYKASDADTEVSVEADETSLTVLVKDGKTYTINFIRVFDKDASLSSVKVNGEEVLPDLSYTVPYDTSEITLDVTATSEKAETAGSSTHYLNVGENNIVISVTAENGDKVDYTLTVTRQTKLLDNDTSLSHVYIDEIEIDMSSFPYTVPFETTKVSITAQAVSSVATIFGVGDHTLNEGENVITLTVIAENGEEKEYLLTVTRLEKVLDGNTSLASVSVNGTNISLSSMKYTVSNSSSSVSVKASASSQTSKVEVSSASSLKVGENRITITVTAENGDKKTYTLVITREEASKSSNADLATMKVEGVDFAFTASRLQYYAEVDNDFTYANITATAKDSGATVKIEGDKNLSTGDNVFTITVTAEDGVTKKVYEVVLERKSNWPNVVYDGTYGLDITNKNDLVSICYSTWFNYVATFNPTASKIISAVETTGNWSSDPATFYYWGEPALGFYRSSDRTVIRTHMTQLSEAGVDFIIIDNTNASVGWKSAGIPSMWSMMITQPVKAILEECLQMRNEGLKTPNIVLWNRAETSDGTGWSVTEAVYDEFYSVEKYKDLWVYWDGKPFFITTDITKNPTRNITVRKMWGLRTSLAVGEWSFLQYSNNYTACKNAAGQNEQICVCTAAQRTYMSVTSTAKGRRGGLTFYEQWQKAFSLRPKVVTLTWWNEWSAQRINGQFTDAYNEEYSRDIEPMKGGHGDTYYQWMIQYIEAYKAHAVCPRLVE